MKAIPGKEVPVQSVTEGECHADAILDGEKTGVLVRAAGMMLDKLHLGQLAADIDTHLAILQHVSPGRIIVAGLAARSMHNRYLDFRYGGVEIEPEIEVVFQKSETEAAEHIWVKTGLHQVG